MRGVLEPRLELCYSPTFPQFPKVRETIKQLLKLALLELTSLRPNDHGAWASTEFSTVHIRAILIKQWAAEKHYVWSPQSSVTGLSCSSVLYLVQ